MRAPLTACLALLAGGCNFDHYGLLPGGASSDGAPDGPPVDDDAAPEDAPRPDPDGPAGPDAAVDAAPDAAVPDAAAPDAPPCPDPDIDPVCTAGTLLGGVSGDTASMALMTSGSTEAWYQVDIVENDDGSLETVTAQIDLVSPPGVDFDLHVTCAACGDARTVSSTNGPGMTDTVQVGRNDVFLTDVGYTIFIEIRWLSSTACGDWTLTVTGDVTTSANPCN